MKRFAILLTCIALLACFVSCSSTAKVTDKHADDLATDTPIVDLSSSDRTIRIMPMGDSLTAGYPATCAYRSYLCKTLLDNGYNVTFVGPKTTGVADNTLPDGSKVKVDRIATYYDFLADNGVVSQENIDRYTHCFAVGGWTIASIMNTFDSLTEQQLAEYDPDIITLMITTNDINSKGFINEQIEEQYRELVARIFRVWPDVTLYAANPLPSVSSGSLSLNARVRDWEIPFLKQLAADKQANGYEMHYVDMTNDVVGLTTDDMRLSVSGVYSDNVHPLDSGNVKLATAWFNAIKPSLDKLS